MGVIYMSEPIKYQIVAEGHPKNPRIVIMVEQEKVVCGLLSFYVKEGYPSITMRVV